MVGFTPQPNDLTPANPDTADLSWLVNPPGSPLAPQDPGWTYGQVLPMAEQDDPQGNPHYKWAWPGAIRSLTQGVVDLVRGAHGDTGGTITPEAENALLAYAMRGLGGKADPNDLGMFLGKKAAQAPAADSPAWFQGTDLRPRFEVSDYNSQIVPGSFGKYHSNQLLAEKAAPGAGLAYTEPLEMHLDHPALYAQYPWLRSLPVSYADLKGEAGAYYYPPDAGVNPQGQIELHNGLNIDQEHSVLLHEVQHAIQNHEGFEGGIGPDDAWNRLGQIGDVLGQQLFRAQGHPDLPQIEQSAGDLAKWMDTHTPADAYMASAGETEARNVQKRLQLQQQSAAWPGPNQKAIQNYWKQGKTLTMPPSRTADVPPAQQFIYKSDLSNVPALHPVEHNPFLPSSPDNPIPVEHDPFAP